jgi:hypothetical protein
VVPRDLDDDTVRVKATERGHAPLRLIGIATLALVVILGLGALTWWLTQAPPPKPVDIRTADESTILVNHAADLDVFRFALNPQILVLDFASMKRQGNMLNRAAAMIEKKGLPRDRPLNDEELDRAIRANGDTPETFYYGHDYSSDDLARVFAAADRLHVKLNDDEIWLRHLLEQEGAGTPGFIRAVISIPAEGAQPPVDRVTRATILHHELSHGEFFTNPRYQAWTLEFWNNGVDADTRAAFTKMLSDDNYDPALGELLANETQAYLCFTPEGQFFNASNLGLDKAAIEALRNKFRVGMPRGWLKDVANDGQLPR